MIAKLVGVRIKELRSQTGLSQVEFAGRIGMARTYFAEVEIGKRNISIRNLLKITNGLNVTLAAFFDSEVFDVIYQDDFGESQYDSIRYSAVVLPPTSD